MVAPANVSTIPLPSPYTPVTSVFATPAACDCNNGLRVANISGCFCSCLDGWVSDPAATDPNSFVWCNRSSGTLYTPAGGGSATLTQAGQVAVAMVCIIGVLCCGCCCYCCRRPLLACARSLGHHITRNTAASRGAGVSESGKVGAGVGTGAEQGLPDAGPRQYHAGLTRLPHRRYPHFHSDGSADGVGMMHDLGAVSLAGDMDYPLHGNDLLRANLSPWLAELPAECPPCDPGVQQTCERGLFMWMMASEESAVDVIVQETQIGSSSEI